MKILISIFCVLAVVLIAFNATKLDFDNLFEGESWIAVVSILAGACVILLMVILHLSKKIARKKK